MTSNEIRVSSSWSEREDQIRHRLRSYRALVSKLAACKDLYDTLFPKTTQTIHDDEPRGGERELFPLESIVQQRMDLSDIMGESLNEMRREIYNIMAVLKPLPPDEYTILLRRYTLAESWEEIEKSTKYCERQLRRIHDRAISRIERNMSDNVRS